MAKSISPPERWPSGEKKRPRRLAQIAEAQKAAEEANMITVLSQPHRRGNRSQLCESRLGRFCLEHKLHPALYDAGHDFEIKLGLYQAAIMAPRPIRLGGNGVDHGFEEQERLKKVTDQMRRVLERGGGYHGKIGVISLVLHENDCAIKIYPVQVIASLYALAIHQGRIKPLALPKSNRVEQS